MAIEGSDDVDAQGIHHPLVVLVGDGVGTAVGCDGRITDRDPPISRGIFYPQRLLDQVRELQESGTLRSREEALEYLARLRGGG